MYINTERQREREGERLVSTRALTAFRICVERTNWGKAGRRAGGKAGTQAGRHVGTEVGREAG